MQIQENQLTVRDLVELLYEVDPDKPVNVYAVNITADSSWRRPIDRVDAITENETGVDINFSIM